MNETPNDMDMALERLERLKSQVERAIGMVNDGLVYPIHDELYSHPPEARIEVGDFIIIDRSYTPYFK